MSENKEKVTGIGGVFFRVKDPVRMAAWYGEHLGIEAADGFAMFNWRDGDSAEAPGSTVWSLFPADTDYFGPAKPAFMINYRVANLEKMVAQIRAGGVTVDKVEDTEYGRFAWITDPEGNRIELYEPKGK
jgi:catechol 2,3-dioxygenase-like lactoylglutathione lyase family enzyme